MSELNNPYNLNKDGIIAHLEGLTTAFLANKANIEEDHPFRKELEEMATTGFVWGFNEGIRMSNTNIRKVLNQFTENKKRDKNE